MRPFILFTLPVAARVQKDEFLLLGIPRRGVKWRERKGKGAISPRGHSPSNYYYYQGEEVISAMVKSL